MDKKTKTTDKSEFANLFDDVKPVNHDKYVPPRQVKKKTAKFITAQKSAKRRKASFEFSDGFSADFDQHYPISYRRDETKTEQYRALKRGLILPDVELDLHGLNRQQAKEEIAELIEYAKKHHFECIKIVHGVSGGVLKAHTPNWLVQHPSVLAFHQAPQYLGGAGAILAIIAIQN